MRFSRLRNTNLNASIICFGTALLGTKLNQEKSFEMLDVYFEQGGNFIDTAKFYGDWVPGEKSISEKIIGLWMKERKNRDKIIIATKGCFPDLACEEIPRVTPENIISDLNHSLQKLNVDCIDLYWLHRDDENQPVEELIDTLILQVKAGKIKYFGCSNWHLSRIQAAQDYAKTKGSVGFIANQPKWSLAEENNISNTDITKVVMNKTMQIFHQETKIAAVPYSSQASGWFQKYDQNKLQENIQKTYQNEVSENRFKKVKALANETGLTISQIVLGYLTSQSFPTFPIIGCQNLAHLNDSLLASDVTLKKEQVEYLEAI